MKYQMKERIQERMKHYPYEVCIAEELEESRSPVNVQILAECMYELGIERGREREKSVRVQKTVRALEMVDQAIGTASALSADVATLKSWIKELGAK